MTQTTRRGFLQDTGVKGASLLLLGTRASGNIIGANDRVRVGVAGLNGRGQSHIGGWLGADNVEIAYVADPDKKVLDRAVSVVSTKSEGKSTPKGVPDIRAALDDGNVDAISVATPNHWHSLLTIWGAQAGKHVYVEKPMSHDVGEGRTVVEAQKKYSATQ
jgi:predicted dehydrogenase